MCSVMLADTAPETTNVLGKEPSSARRRSRMNYLGQGRVGSICRFPSPGAREGFDGGVLVGCTGGAGTGRLGGFWLAIYFSGM